MVEGSGYSIRKERAMITFADLNAKSQDLTPLAYWGEGRGGPLPILSNPFPPRGGRSG